MKILFCLNDFLPKHVAGTEVYVLSLATELKKKGIECIILIPNYGITFNGEYEFSGIRVIQYAETSVKDRALIMGKRLPDGIPFFLDILKTENPDIIHFHELAGSNGITLHHIIAAKVTGFKVVMTFHLAGYSCKTGSLMYKDKDICDGVIRIKRCSACYYYVRKSDELFSKVITPIGMLFFNAGLDTTSFGNKLGTTFGVPFIIEKLKNDLITLESNCDKLVVLTEWYKKILVNNKIPLSKISLIKQAIPFANNSHRQRTNINTTCLKIIFVGRISRFKGVHLIIEALKEINGNAQLDIYGQINEADYAAECKALSKNMNNIHWKGALAPRQVISIIAAYDILCLPSTFSEMSPLVIQEAFEAGVPVMASDVYGNAEQIKNGNGWLFKFKDSSDLKRKLQQLVDNPALIEIAKTKILPVKKFALVADEHERLYKEVIGEL